MRMKITCVECRRPVTFEVDELGYVAWVNGALIQNALPDLPASLREMLITQICPTCFDKLFAGTDDGDDTTDGIS